MLICLYHERLTCRNFLRYDQMAEYGQRWTRELFRRCSRLLLYETFTVVIAEVQPVIVNADNER